MENFPIFIDINKKPVTIFGGGDIALRKAILLIKANPLLTIVAKEFSEDFMEFIKENKLSFLHKSYEPSDIKSQILIVAATDNKSINKSISKTAEEKRIPVNVVDQPELCTFTMGSIVERDALVIAISSGGKAPVLARMIREKMEGLIPSSYAKLVCFAGTMRNKVKKKINQMEKRRGFWEDFFSDNQILNKANNNKKFMAKDIDTLIKKRLGKFDGEVYLVGAGPGDRDLLTLRALQLMQKCDICIFDNLVSQDVLGLVRRDADMIYAGKKRDQHTLEQATINDLLMKYAKKGKRVLRLKGGDPFIFGRGGEEIEGLMKENIPFQVVPGISAANGISSYSGIPLTHRDHAQSCLFLTGHFKNGVIDFDWPKLIVHNQTLVIYMGLLSLDEMKSNLIKHGMNQNMPVAVVQSGTTNNQKVVIGELKNIKSRVSKANIKSPALIIIGTVVNLRKDLSWFD
jgi:uroporphyrin-III C-methyltransferase/precorrin-2 dehydrogenase/sirohydrochlorin ferrochelatase